MKESAGLPGKEVGEVCTELFKSIQETGKSIHLNFNGIEIIMMNGFFKKSYDEYCQKYKTKIELVLKLIDELEL